MPTDDALARALAENRRRSEVMAEAQRFGPPHRPEAGDTGTGRTPPESDERPVEGPVAGDDEADSTPGGRASCAPPRRRRPR